MAEETRGAPYEIYGDSLGSALFGGLVAAGLGTMSFWAWPPWDMENPFGVIFFWAWPLLCLTFGVVGLLLVVRGFFVPVLRADPAGVRCGRFRAGWTEIREVVVGTLETYHFNPEEPGKSGHVQRRAVWVYLNSDLRHEWQAPTLGDDPPLADLRDGLARHAGTVPVRATREVLRRRTWSK
ncbi:hypothetical protein NX801_16295 [Streptomyces sp. LP05-1]|uniref:Integral membrane protein n=1 Tax=Streptomyces pyxinae TaxID=2970734 RepID=A0ABT2CIF5_9ACTN|nr:hypothetical protein [Streptomyces sp. LP05-1]MCS0637194.1 hypothetical protein [Streptomyces sp. LP05-1]